MRFDKPIAPAAAAPATRSTAPAAPRDSIWSREIEFSRTFSPKEKQTFFQTLAALLNSGLSITESLEIVAEQTARRKTRAVIERLSRSLAEGNALSEAVALQQQYFSPFEIYSLKMGESAGRVPQVLNDLAIFHEKRLKLQRKFIQAFSYPLIVMCIAGGVMMFMITFVVPMFQDIFARFDAELPAITQAVLSLSEFSRDWGWIFLLVLLTAAGVLIRVRKTPAFRRILSRLALRIPLLGTVLLKIQLSRFCYTLSLMLRSRVKLDQALELTSQIVQFYPIQSTLAQIRKDVMEGKTLFEAVSRHPIYPGMVRQMVRVGEKTARLDEMMERLGKNLEEEGEGAIGTLTSLLEPLLIVVVGLIVGIILVSMYLPMFELSNTISN